MENLIFLADARGMAFNIIRNFLVFLDSAIYTLMGWILEAIFNISGTELLEASVYQTIMQRVYVILGIFMLFKLSISLIGYLVNPDSIADKEKGMGKVVMRAFLMIIMLMMLTPFFNIMTRVQGYILPVIPKIILGKDMDTGGASAASTAKSVGEEMAIVSYRAFFRLDTNCTEGGDDATRTPGMTVSKISSDDLEQEPCGDNEDLYKYDYLPVVPLIVGVVIDLLLVGFAIDVGSRVFKLAILRVIAPIPILSYIDPKSSKDGGTFSNWLKSFMGTWMDLFIKLAIIYFVLFVIEIVAEGGLVGLDISTPAGAFASIFVIIGLLFFAKQAPAFIMNAMGIKGKGMGAGIGGTLAGMGALLGGAGLAGAGRAFMDQAQAEGDAAATGKAAPGAWGRGRDIAAQMRTGDKDAKGGFVAAMGRRADLNAAENRAKRLGLGAENVDALKSNMLKKESDLTMARDELAKYQTAVENGTADFNQETFNKLQGNVRAKNEIYGEANRAFEKAKSGRESIVPANGAVDNYSRRPTARARNNTSKSYERGITDVAGFDRKIAKDIDENGSGSRFATEDVNIEYRDNKPKAPTNRPLTDDDPYDSNNPGD